jgi:dTMP kinase
VAGMFITFEGIDGCGKSTQIELLYQKLLEDGYKTELLREPGGTEVGERIRVIVLKKENSSMSIQTEMLLFLAARSQLVREKIRPMKNQGIIVLCDRFIDSTVAYQGFGREIGKEFVDQMNRFAIAETIPDITYLLDLDPDRAVLRVVGRKRPKDRMDSEGIDFLRKVRYGYSVIAAENPGRVKVLDAQKKVEDLSCEIYRIFKEVTK